MKRDLRALGELGNGTLLSLAANPLATNRGTVRELGNGSMVGWRFVNLLGVISERERASCPARSLVRRRRSSR
jgi:hypothetical protein